MAKIASSKPYGSGKKNTPTKPTKAEKAEKVELTSPVRTSPRRRKSIADEPPVLENVAVVEPKGRKPAAPKFTDSKKRKEKEREVEVEKKRSSPRSSRRKSALEPVILEGEREIEREPEPDYNSNNEEEEDVTDYIGSIQREESASTSIYKPSTTEEENSPVFEEEYIEDEEEAFHFDDEEEGAESEDEQSSGYNSQFLNEGESYTDHFRYTSSTVRSRLAQYFKKQESSVSDANSSRSQIWSRMREWIGETFMAGAKELGELTVEYTKKAIEQIASRLEKPAAVPEITSAEDVSIYEDEPRIYEITDPEIDADGQGDYAYEGEEFDYSGDKQGEEADMDFDEKMEYKKTKLMDFESDEQQLANEEQSRKTSYHSVPEHDSALNETVIYETQNTPHHTAQIPKTPQANKIVTEHSEILDSRLTEIVLFLAKVTGSTPLASIYEHLEEFFTLKGSFGLNYIEKQLVSSVVRDFLTESDDKQPASMAVPVYDPVVLSSSINESPSRVKVLPSSGIRFRAPKFTLEEEVRLEELEKARLKNLATTAKVSSLSTPMQRSRLQKKLLAPERENTSLTSLAEIRGRSVGSVRKEDSVSAAIENIISQKVKEAKEKEEAERIETEKLKARVVELEREARERATKEALLQKQLEEQKKELEIEKEAAKVKIESLKKSAAAAVVSKSVAEESKPAFSFGASKPANAESTLPLSSTASPFGASSFSFGNSSSKPAIPAIPAATSAAPATFSFGKISDEKAPSFDFGGDAKIPSEDKTVKDSANPFKSFTFGATSTEDSKTAGDVVESVKTATSPFGSVFTFGVKKSEDSNPAGSDVTAPKPSTSPFGNGFSFGVKADGESEEKKSSPAASFGFSFGDKKTVYDKANDSKTSTTTMAFGSGFSIPVIPALPTATTAKSTETTSSTATPAPANPFTFGAAKAAESTAQSKAPAFSFGGDSSAKPASLNPTFSTSAFSFGAPPKEAASASNNTNPFSFSAPSAAKNPFEGLSSAGNIFNSGANTTTAFSFGQAPPVQNNFTFPSLNAAGSNAPIIPMNFGGSAPQSQPTGDQQPAEMAFQAGNRPISIPKRRRK